MTRPALRHAPFLALVAVAALALALPGGTPVQHPDSLVGKSLFALEHHGRPPFFNYPALVIYLHSGAYALYDAFSRLLPETISASLWTWPLRDLPGHLLTAFFSVLGALSCYGAGYVLTRSRPHAAFGALLLITAPLWNADAHFTTVDIPLAALCSLTLFVGVSLVERSAGLSPRHVLVLGVLLGLTAAAKYTGASMAVFVATLLLLRIRPFSLSLAAVVGCAATALVTFAAVNPYILMELTPFWQDFIGELRHAREGHFGYTTELWHYPVSESLRYGWGWIPGLLSVSGAALLLADRTRQPVTRWAVVTFPVFFLLVLSGSRLAFQRYALPLLPFLAVLAAYAVFGLQQHLEKRLSIPWRWVLTLTWTVVVVFVIGSNGATCLRHNLLLGSLDTRSVLTQAFRENKEALASSRIGGDWCTWGYLGDAKDVRPIEGSPHLEILVLDSFCHDRFLYDRRRRLGIDFSRFENGGVVTLSPFRESKETVPFSPKSVYSPYEPDLPYRAHPGPYVEVYFSDALLAERIHLSLSLSGLRVGKGPASSGYYFERL